MRERIGDWSPIGFIPGDGSKIGGATGLTGSFMRKHTKKDHFVMV